MASHMRVPVRLREHKGIVKRWATFTSCAANSYAISNRIDHACLSRDRRTAARLPDTIRYTHGLWDGFADQERHYRQGTNGYRYRVFRQPDAKTGYGYI